MATAGKWRTLGTGGNKHKPFDRLTKDHLQGLVNDAVAASDGTKSAPRSGAQRPLPDRMPPYCSHAAGPFTSKTTKAPHLRDFLEADDGTRTHDLLHGKQTL